MTTASLERKIKVPLDKTWSLLSDFTGTPSPAFPVIVHEKGDEKYKGVGTIRTIKLGMFSVMERLEAVEPHQSYMYCILAGSPVKQYLGKWEFQAENDETILRWSADFRPKFPLTGWIIGLVTKRVVHRIIDQMEADHLED